MTPEDLQQIRALVREENTQIRALVREELTVVREEIAALREEITAAEERAQEFARNIETNLLSAFHSYARGQTARLHSVETTNADLAIRIAALEDRMLNVETRRPPPQPHS